MSANANHAAFPVITERHDVEGRAVFFSTDGLTKREYFAALAMQAMIPKMAGKDQYEAMAWIATTAPKIADALLAELSRTEPKATQ